MCGLASFFSTMDLEETRRSMAQMLEIQLHRGPDSTGLWCGTVSGLNIGVGLNRLKILDLSDAANQPMEYALDEEQLLRLFRKVEIAERLI